MPFKVEPARAEPVRAESVNRQRNNSLLNNYLSPSHSTKSVPVSFLLQMVQAVELKGLSLGPMQKVIDDLREQSLTRISLDTYTEYFWRFRMFLDDELLGFFPHPVPIGVYQTLCQALVHMETVGQCLDYMNQLYRLFNNNIEPWKVEVTSGLGVIRVKTQDFPNAALPFYQQSMLLTPYKTISWLIGANCGASRIGFTHEQTDNERELSYIFSSIPVFNQQDAFIEFPAEILNRPITQSISGLECYLKKSLTYIIQGEFGETFIDKIRGQIIYQVKTGFPTLPELGEVLGITAPTFSRRLKEHGSTYNRIKDELRRDLAIHYLSKTKLSVNEIATEIGFSEYSSFHRAFKKWVGVTPTDFRHSVDYF